MLEEKVQKEENPILDIVVASLEDGKAEDMVVIDLRGKTSIAKSIAACSASSLLSVLSTPWPPLPWPAKFKISLALPLTTVGRSERK